MLTRDTGAFVAAPVGGLLWGFGAFALRLAYQWVNARVKGHRFDALDRPVAPPPPSFYTGRASDDENYSDVDRQPVVAQEIATPKGKFF